MLADQIAKLIEEMLEEGGGSLELQRNEMAGRLGCVPSQISYVITSRFTPERGYIIESRRGGGGHIRIVRKQMHRNEYLMHFFYAIGDAIDEKEARAYLVNLLDQDIITPREALIIEHAVSGAALQDLTSDVARTVRARMFRHILLSLMK
ncbi:MAG: CtsR family transcriptional regulator [Ruminococcaceae bacterium]|nr:CtsR family transcriptional regulator [Oscillospiraceae bacterium]